MTVKKEAGGTWSVDFYVDGRGSQRVRRGGFKSKAHALRFERDYSLDTPTHTGSLSSLVELWYKAHGSMLKSGLRRKNALLQTVERLGDPSLSSFNLQKWLDYRHIRMLDVLPSTFNIEQLHLSAVFSTLIDLGLISYINPLAKAPLFKIEQNTISYLSLDQIDILFREISKSRNPYLSIIARICLSTGSRWSEAEKLTRTQLLSDRIVFVRTKSLRSRTVPVDPVLIDEIRRVALPGDRLFSNARGAFEQAYRRTGFFTPQQLTHILRHTFASQFVIAGGDLRTLMDILGHADIRTTMRYSHLAPEHLHKALHLNPLALSSARSQAVAIP